MSTLSFKRPIEADPFLSGALNIVGRHGKTEGEGDDRYLTESEKDRANDLAQQLLDAGADLSVINSSPQRRALETARAMDLSGFAKINHDERLREVKFSRLLTVIAYTLGYVPKKHKDRAREVIEATGRGELRGYSSSHGGITGAISRVIDEYSDLKAVSYTTKKGKLVLDNRERKLLPRRATTKHLGGIAIMPADEL